MNSQKGRYEEEMGTSEGTGRVVVVAVKASRDISKTALVWALTHVVQPGDCIKLLVVIPAHSASKRVWGLSRFTTDCTTSHWRSSLGTVSDQKEVISNSCSQLVLQLHDFYDPEKIKIRVKILSGSLCGAVAAEAKRVQSSWVILDKKLKHEKKYCMEQLHCNIVIMKRSRPKILRLNLNSSPKMDLKRGCSLTLEPNAYTRNLKNKCEYPDRIRGPAVTPASSPEQGSPLLTATDIGTSSISSSDPGTSPFFHPNNYERQRRSFPFVHEGLTNLEDIESDSESEKLSISSKSSYFQPWIANVICIDGDFSKHEDNMQRSSDKTLVSTYDTLLQKFSKLDQDPILGMLNCKIDVNLSKSVREAISLAKSSPPGPPPLCSVCQHKAPVFGNPPRWFTFAELQLATGGFSQANFLAEGGFGSVHRGVLPDGQVIAVKQYKLASTQGDKEFCSEVEVLSCAQHRNVVMLIGFCVEDGRRLLVYEYICHGSLDSHLYGRKQNVLEWSARQKIAVGAARGLRYLHEECRVGCIVHRDMRPNNILLTHDFEALVGDFGLARWQPDGDMGVETRVIGTFGYLAPEYAQSGQITEKADVYSFGIVLLELVTGRKAVDINRPKGQQCLSEWARPLLEKHAIHKLVDPSLRNCYVDQEVYRMLQCSSLCIGRDPHLRPRMSQVLRMLEGDILM
ncbi:inactive protein kinase SELMODRAFT_444075-like [Abrus precatorius]|uniref:Inactive protein kinase SELMODRAFT_444075-like n=1 Tax=Abrus precatorius TaxID=3816 RepID=A0A8B8KEN9_ABRPR|nr:inactive protein kinase SELMODRAFT_444075-like [Abrus precatorius]